MLKGYRNVVNRYSNMVFQLHIIAKMFSEVLLGTIPGSSLGASWVLLGGSWKLLGSSWVFLWEICTLAGRSWRLLGSSWVLLVRSWDLLGNS